MNDFRLCKQLVAACFAFGFLSGATAIAAVDAEGVLKRAAGAMGANDLKTIRFAASGSGATFGQAFKPGGAWPRLNYSTFSRLADYENGALREDFARSRAEPTGGGAVPHTGEQRLSTFVHGDRAWNLAGPNPTLARVALETRIHDLWTTPHGVIMAARRNKATLTFKMHNGREYAAVSFTEPGRFSATVLIDENFLVTRVDARVPHPVYGDTPVVTEYADYRDHGGVKFPARIRQSAGAVQVLDLAVKEVQPNAAASIQVPEGIRTATERVTTEKAADGVWFLAGGSHNSVAIEMKDHIIVVEAPLYDGRTGAMLEVAGKLVPGKAVRSVISSHNHFDHSGGLRAAAATGATLIVHADSKPYFERLFANPNRIHPDLLAASGRKPKIVGVSGKRVLSDGMRTVEVHAIKGSVHADAFLLVYLPAEKLLIEADAFTPAPPNSPPPSPPNVNHVNLTENIERLKLSIDRILPLHGRIVPLAELYRMVGK